MMEQKLLVRMIRMACDCVLTMDKLAGYSDTKLKIKLAERYAAYFHFDWTEELREIARKTFRNREKECSKASQKMLLRQCMTVWVR